MQLDSSAITRFWSKVKFSESCWIWRGSIGQKGYGLFPYGGQNGHNVNAHRVAYTLVVGPIADGLEIDHLCRTRNCVRPAHLEAVTHQENIRRGWRYTKTHCLRGHLRSAENLYTHKNGSRSCRICRKAEKQRWNARHRRGYSIS